MSFNDPLRIKSENLMKTILYWLNILRRSFKETINFPRFKGKVLEILGLLFILVLGVFGLNKIGWEMWGRLSVPQHLYS